jgi:hypothetical protein
MAKEFIIDTCPRCKKRPRQKLSVYCKECWDNRLLININENKK